MDPAAREKLKATLLGMVGSAMQKYPSASKGDLKDVWNAAVDERYAARRAKEAEEPRSALPIDASPQPASGKRRSRIPERPPSAGRFSHDPDAPAMRLWRSASNAPTATSRT